MDDVYYSFHSPIFTRKEKLMVKLINKLRICHGYKIMDEAMKDINYCFEMRTDIKSYYNQYFNLIKSYNCPQSFCKNVAKALTYISFFGEYLLLNVDDNIFVFDSVYFLRDVVVNDILNYMEIENKFDVKALYDETLYLTPCDENEKDICNFLNFITNKLDTLLFIIPTKDNSDILMNFNDILPESLSCVDNIFDI